MTLVAGTAVPHDVRSSAAILMLHDASMAVWELTTTLQHHLFHATTDVQPAASAMTAIRRQRYDVIITPVQGTGVDVLAVLAVAQQTQPLTPVLIIMRADQVAPAVQAFLVGAFDVLPDASEDRVVGWVHTALTVSRLRRHVRWRARELDRLRQGVTKSDQDPRPGELQHRMLPSSSATAVAQASDLAMVVRHKEAILARKRSRLQKLERQVYQTAWLKLYALLSSC